MLLESRNFLSVGWSLSCYIKKKKQKQVVQFQTFLKRFLCANFTSIFNKIIMPLYTALLWIDLDYQFSLCEGTKMRLSFPEALRSWLTALSSIYVCIVSKDFV